MRRPSRKASPHTVRRRLRDPQSHPACLRTHRRPLALPAHYAEPALRLPVLLLLLMPCQPPRHLLVLGTKPSHLRSQPQHLLLRLRHRPVRPRRRGRPRLLQRRLLRFQPLRCRLQLPRPRLCLLRLVLRPLRRLPRLAQLRLQHSRHLLQPQHLLLGRSRSRPRLLERRLLRFQPLRCRLQLPRPRLCLLRLVLRPLRRLPRLAQLRLQPSRHLLQPPNLLPQTLRLRQLPVLGRQRLLRLLQSLLRSSQLLPKRPLPLPRLLLQLLPVPARPPHVRRRPYHPNAERPPLIPPAPLKLHLHLAPCTPRYQLPHLPDRQRRHPRPVNR